MSNFQIAIQFVKKYETLFLIMLNLAYCVNTENTKSIPIPAGSTLQGPIPAGLL